MRLPSPRLLVDAARTLEQEQKKAQSQITAFKLQTRQLQKQADKATERAQGLQHQLEASQQENHEVGGFRIMSMRLAVRPCLWRVFSAAVWCGSPVGECVCMCGVPRLYTATL